MCPLPCSRPIGSGPSSGAKVGVVVLGPGRSGTSAVTRMFVSAGFWAGPEAELVPASEGNPTGHWESFKVWRANESVLTELAGTWFDPPAETQQLAAREWALPRLRGVFDQLLADRNDRPVVLKDPRVGVMMPLWRPIIEEHLHPVLVIRDPLEIAMSLTQRDGTPTSFALAMWQLHMTTLLSHLNGTVVTVAPYAELLGSSEIAERVIGSTVGHLRPQLAGRACRPPTAPDHALRRNQAGPDDHEQQVSVHQVELWAELASLAPGEQRINVPERLLECSEAVRRTVRAETERRETSQREQELRQAMALGRERTDTVTAELTDERARARQAEADRLRAVTSLEAIKSSLSWRATRPLRAAKRQLAHLLGAAK